MLDHAIVIFYLLVTLVVGVYVGRNTKTLEDFAVGPRNYPTIILVSTVFASVVDAGMTTGLASSTFSVGPLFLISFLGIVFSSLSVAYFIAPRMKQFLGLISSGDIFEKLYGKNAKILMGCSTIIESVLTTAIQMFAIAQIGQYFFNMSPLVASVVVALIIILYTFRGGIRSVTATDVFQFGIMVIAIPIMCGIGLIKVGGVEKVASLLHEYPLFFPSANEPSYFEYLASFLAFCLPSLYPLCIQRMLMAKNTQQISSTFLINGLLSLPFYLSVGMIGIIAYIAIPGTDANVVFPTLINHVLPIGAKGLVLAGLIAVFMSTVDSILNIGSLAIIHDVVGSLVKSGLAPKTELRLLKLASMSIAILAVVVCQSFSSVMDIVFFLMVIGNSVFFPGFFWGILGVRASSTGFWFGVLGGVLTVAICGFMFDLFPLYTMLLAIGVNSSVLLLDYYLEKPIETLSISSFIRSDYREIVKNVRRNAFFSDSFHNHDYCTVFFVCAIIVSLFPFFFPAILGLRSFDPTILTLSTIIAVVSLCMLFRELWWDYVDKAFPVIWIMALTLALPAQSFYLLFRSNFSVVWLMDCIIILPLLFVLMTRSAMSLSLGLGLVMSLCFVYLSESSVTPEIAASFGYWALVVHITVLAICLALFRKRDQETFMVTSSTLAHEASRSFLAFENAACYLNSYLPKIISHYRAVSDVKDVSDKALDELLALPLQLENAAKRSRGIVEKLSFFSISAKAHFETFNVLVSINSAIFDPSIKTKVSGKISVSNKAQLLIKGDIDQITQVFINLLENAHHATMRKSDSTIEIIVNQDTVYVRDTGDGIDKNDIISIFDENFSTKSTRGQGLAFCKRVMRNHGGTISCTSIKGEFTEFRLSFPAVKNG